MKHLLHVTEDHSTANTGITTAVDSLMRQVGNEFELSLLCSGNEMVPLPEAIKATEVKINPYLRFWRASPGKTEEVTHNISTSDVIHIHGIWMWIQWASARQARKLNKPFILSIHGMLEPWIWQRQEWPDRMKKKLYWQSLAYPAFKHAKAIHAVHQVEAVNLQRYFSTRSAAGGNPEIVVIPPGLDIQSIDRTLSDIASIYNNSDLSLASTSFPKDAYILFLGRLHPVKGIDVLIQAFARLQEKGIKLKIAGYTQSREAAYAENLHRLAADAGVGERVEFLGGVLGKQKWELLKNAWVFCLPSHSEVISMVNLEAAACSTPVITTHATGVGPAWAANGGILINPVINELKGALSQALSWSMEERIHRGNTLRRLIETNYSWNITARQWIDLYRKVGIG